MKSNSELLFEAIKQGDVDKVSQELTVDNINRPDLFGFPPLYYAVFHGHTTIVSLLLAKGANKYFLTQHNENFLHIAAQKGHEELVSVLIQQGVFLKGLTINNETPLNYAAISGHLGTIKLFVEHLSPINWPGKDDQTPLHSAVIANHLSVINYLLSFEKINLEAIDKKQLTPYDYAIASSNQAIISLFNLAYLKKQLRQANPILDEKSQAITPLQLAKSSSNQEFIALLNAFANAKGFQKSSIQRDLQLLKPLHQYLVDNAAREDNEHRHAFIFFCIPNPFGFSAGIKKAAAEALMEYALDKFIFNKTISEDVLKPHLPALNEGKLGKLYSELCLQNNVSCFVDSNSLIFSLKQFWNRLCSA